MDGLDITHIHFTQEHPEAPLYMKLLHDGEIPFDGPLKSKATVLSMRNVWAAAKVENRACDAPH